MGVNLHEMDGLIEEHRVTCKNAYKLIYGTIYVKPDIITLRLYNYEPQNHKSVP